MNINRVLEHFRQVLGYTQNEFATMLNMSQSKYNKIINGKTDELTVRNAIETASKVLEIPTPILLLYAIGEKDISEKYRKKFTYIKPYIDSLILTIIRPCDSLNEATNGKDI